MQCKKEVKEHSHQKADPCVSSPLRDKCVQYKRYPPTGFRCTAYVCMLLTSSQPADVQGNAITTAGIIRWGGGGLYGEIDM